MTPPTTIPARLTVSALADAISAELSDVQKALADIGHPDAPDDFVGPAASVGVASSLGHSVAIEPRDLALETLYENETGEMSEDQLSGRDLRPQGDPPGVGPGG